MSFMDGVVPPSSVPQARRGEVSQIEIPKESHHSLKEKVYQAEISKESRPSKKKKHNHKEGSKKTPRTEDLSSMKWREAKNVSEALHPRMEED